LCSSEKGHKTAVEKESLHITINGQQQVCATCEACQRVKITFILSLSFFSCFLLSERNASRQATMLLLLILWNYLHFTDITDNGKLFRIPRQMKGFIPQSC